jgi:hypothetical protein
LSYLRDKLRKLEQPYALDAAAERMFAGLWSVEDQIVDSWEKIREYQRFFPGETDPLYPATDREIRMIAAMCAMVGLGAEYGTYEFPSGLVLTVDEDRTGDDLFVETNRPVAVEDLPDYAAHRLGRLGGTSADQKDRDVELFERWRSGRGAKVMRRVEERLNPSPGSAGVPQGGR